MSKQFISIASDNPGSTTSYIAVQGCAEFGTSDFNGWEPWATAGVISNLIVVLATAPGAGKTRVCTLLLNGVAQTLTCTVSDTAVTARDVTHSVTVAPGDYVSWQWTSTGTPTTTALVRVACEFDSTTANQSNYSIQSGGVADGVTRWNGVFAGRGTLSTWEPTAANRVTTVCPTAGTISALYCRLSSALTSQTYTVWIYLNGVKQDGTGGTTNTAVAITGPAQTGSRTGFSLAVVAGDKLYYECSPTNNPPSKGMSCGICFTATTAGESIMGGLVCSGTPTGSTGYSYYGCGTPAAAGWAATEANGVSIGCLNKFKIANTYVIRSVAPAAGKSDTYSVRVNSASPGGAPSVAIADAATTGNDTSGNTQIQDTDTFDMRVIPAGTPTTGFASWSSVITAVGSSGKGAGKGGGHRGGGGNQIIYPGGAYVINTNPSVGIQ